MLVIGDEGHALFGDVVAASRMLKKQHPAALVLSRGDSRRYFPWKIPELLFVQGAERPPSTPTQGVFQHPAGA